MAQDTTVQATGADCEAMGAIDDGDVEQYIVAYPCRDDAWVSVPLADAATLSDWR